MSGLLLVVGLAHAQATVAGDVKSFFLATFPYEHEIMPEDPTGTGILSLRLKGDLRHAWGDKTLALTAHLASAATAPASSGGLGTFGTQAGSVPEAVDLSWALDGDSGLDWTARADWLVLQASVPHLDLTLGRQPVTFGHALLFTPLDLVAPFHPAVIDQEYKPGADAARVDGYAGTSTQVTAVAAYAGDWDASGLVLCGYGQTTLGVWDLGLMAASVRGDLVGGLTTTGSLGPLGLWAEATLTRPEDDQEDPFVRAVAGGDARPTDKIFVALEAYYQSLGADDPADYLQLALGDRYRRGEVWEMGRYYLGLTGSYELTPIVALSGFVLANLGDPSALVGPALAWSVAGNASVSAGAYMGLGERPGEIDWTAMTSPADFVSAIPVNSEFGLVPVVLFVSVNAYF